MPENSPQHSSNESDDKKKFFSKIGIKNPDQRSDDPSVPPVDHEQLLAYENDQLLPEEEADISWYLASSSKWREAQHKIFGDQSLSEESRNLSGSDQQGEDKGTNE